MISQSTCCKSPLFQTSNGFVSFQSLFKTIKRLFATFYMQDLLKAFEKFKVCRHIVMNHTIKSHYFSSLNAMSWFYTTTHLLTPPQKGYFYFIKMLNELLYALVYSSIPFKITFLVNSYFFLLQGNNNNNNKKWFLQMLFFHHFYTKM